MPELPEIAVRSQEMKTGLVGKTITGVEVIQPKILNLPPLEFTYSVTGGRFLDVSYRGKWLFVEMTTGWLLLNLGMGGEILLVTRQTLPEKYRLILDFDDSTCLAVNFWWFGHVHYVPTNELKSHTMTAKLGPNAIDLTRDEFAGLLHGRRGGIKSFLLNQSHIAGIGNVYIQDPLFKASLHPLRPINSLDDDEVEALHVAIQDTLQESIDLGGSAWEQNLYGGKGCWDSSYFLVAYREGEPCPNCGTSVHKIKTGSTSSFICPSCQPLT
jgi:formamidopyrimidine-DNA glycosylase